MKIPAEEIATLADAMCRIGCLIWRRVASGQQRSSLPCAKNPALDLRCILPCDGQERKWPVQTQRRYRSILEQANDMVCVGREYTSNCMLKRNRYLVDHATVLLAIYDGSLSN